MKYIETECHLPAPRWRARESKEMCAMTALISEIPNYSELEKLLNRAKRAKHLRRDVLVVLHRKATCRGLTSLRGADSRIDGQIVSRSHC